MFPALCLLLPTGLLLTWVSGVTYGAECTNLCSGDPRDWCGNYKYGEGGQVQRCADRTRYGLYCSSPCDNGKCATGNAENGQWEHCSQASPSSTNTSTGPYRPMTKEGKKCVKMCAKQGEGYFWCKTDSSEWDYCSPPSQVIRVTYTKEGQECVNPCDRYGKGYWWCNKPVRWKYTGGAGGPRSDDDNWDYCSPDHHHTRYNEKCKSKCEQKGKRYFWCYTAKSWDYCAPKVVIEEANSPSKRKGHSSQATAPSVNKNIYVIIITAIFCCQLLL